MDAQLSYHLNSTTNCRLAEFLQQAIHDARSPMAFLEIICQMDAEEITKHRIQIESALSRIAQIFNSNYVKGNSFKIEAVSIIHLLKEVISEKKILNKDTTIYLEFSPHIVNTKINSSQIELARIFSNLINNSIDALPPHGHIVISIQENMDRMEIKIADNGCGMSEDIIEKVFTRGFTHKKANGSGLGLYHAKYTLKALSGSISLESQPHIGTIITISLPRFI